MVLPMKNYLFILFFIVFFAIEFSFAQCSPQVLTNASGGRLIFFYPGDAPANDAALVNFTGLDIAGHLPAPIYGVSQFTLTAINDFRLRTDQNASPLLPLAPATFSGTVTFNYSTGGPVSCTYTDGVLTALPIDLIDFKINTDQSSIKLTWTTASELNNEGFEIQRSRDGITFERIGWVDGKGTTQESSSYAFTDEVGGVSYYRLKQMDFDGQFKFSKVVFADVSDFIGDNFSLVTNLVTRGEDLRIVSNIDSDYRVFNGNGALISSGNLYQGNVTYFSTANLAAGTYYISYANQKSGATKFIVTD